MFYGIPGGAGGLGSPYELVGGGGIPIFSLLNIPGATIIGLIRLSGGFGGKMILPLLIEGTLASSVFDSSWIEFLAMLSGLGINIFSNY